MTAYDSDAPAEDMRDYKVRNILFFTPGEIPAHSEHYPSKTFTIEVMPVVECLVQRIVMHASIAKRLALKQILVGQRPVTPAGNGSCEIFLYDVPNWTPSRMVITPERPLLIIVKNWDDRPYKTAGSVVVYEKG